MAQESKHNTILRIGYLNDMEVNGHLLENYMDTFDIVVTGDGPLSPINYILNNLFVSE